MVVLALAPALDARAQPGPLLEWGSIVHKPAPPGLFTLVAGGEGHAAALREDGVIVTWGASPQPEPPPPGQYLGLAAGFEHTCAISPDGTVVCWGLNHIGQCTAPPGRFIKIAAGYSASAGVREDGTLATWGFNAHLPVPPGTFRDAWVGKQWYLAQRTDGTLIAWGDPEFGNLIVPTEPVLTATASETWFGLAIRLDGTIIHWGCECSVASGIPSGQFVRVYGGGNCATALRADGTVVAWGHNSAGQGIAPPARFLALDMGRGFGVGITTCYANCDGSTTPPVLNVNDFICFLGHFAADEQYANCDGSTTPPVRNVNDFVCFMGRYAAGCP